MKTSFAARRKPRAIAREDDEDNNESQAHSSSVTIASAVKRPGDRLKKLSSKQTSFSGGAGRNTKQNVSDEEADSFVIKKSNLSQQAIARNAQRKAGIRLPDERLPLQQQRIEDDGQAQRPFAYFFEGGKTVHFGHFYVEYNDTHRLFILCGHPPVQLTNSQQSARADGHAR